MRQRRSIATVRGPPTTISMMDHSLPGEPDIALMLTREEIALSHGIALLHLIERGRMNARHARRLRNLLTRCTASRILGVQRQSASCGEKETTSRRAAASRRALRIRGVSQLMPRVRLSRNVGKSAHEMPDRFSSTRQRVQCAVAANAAHSDSSRPRRGCGERPYLRATIYRPCRQTQRAEPVTSGRCRANEQA